MTTKDKLIVALGYLVIAAVGIASFLVALAASGCSPHTSHPSPVATFTLAPSGIPAIRAGGVLLTAPGGGLYAIGSCTGADNPKSNVDSRYGGGTTIASPDGSCAASPFKTTVTHMTDKSVHVVTIIGPTSVAYATLSVPLDLAKDQIIHYEFGAGPLYVNGDTLTASPVGDYAAIPTPFTIPSIPPPNRVGFVHSKRPVPWVTGYGPHGGVRRVFYTGSSLTDVYAYNHPATNNLEASFHAVPKGATLRLEEDIIVY